MQKSGSKKAVRRRPVSNEELINSILYIKARDEYLQNAGILTRIGPRRWRLSLKILK